MIRALNSRTHLAPLGTALGGLWLALRPEVARADMPPPPALEPLGRGTAHHSCDGARIHTSYCPPGAYCNYRYQAFVDCGGGACVMGRDPGRCPAPEAQVQPGVTQADCKGRWESVCLGRKVTEACLATVDGQTSINPPFLRCGESRCTTSRFVEDCYPTRKELGKAPCDGAWEKVCLFGKVQERCAPKSPPAAATGDAAPGSQHANAFVSCGGSRCAVGTEKSACELGE